MANERANGTTYDPTRGLIGVGVFDCLTSPANNVDVTLDGGDEGTVVVGAVDAGPRALPTGQSGVGANGAGRVIFFNVPPGTVTLTATPQALGKPVEQINVSVEAGTLTQVGMYSYRKERFPRSGAACSRVTSEAGLAQSRVRQQRYPR